MRCTSCGQMMTQMSADGCCPLCGARQPLRRPGLVQLYLVTGALFFSVLIYGALVAIFEATGVEVAGPADPTLVTAVLLIPAIGLPVAILVHRALLGRGDAAAVKTALIVLAAYCESIALTGFVVYVLSRDIRMFTILLGLSVVGFSVLAFKVPRYAALVEGDGTEPTT